MNGKVLKVINNNIDGKQEEKYISVFAVFEHKKYMNKYLIFCFQDEYNKKKLLYGSVHFNKDSLITFSVNENEKSYIEEFIKEYTENNVNQNEYGILNISEMTRSEVISYNSIDFDQLEKLDQMSIQKQEEVQITKNNKKPLFLYFILFILIVSLIGVTYLYLNPDILNHDFKKINCTANKYNDDIQMEYFSEYQILFDYNNKLDTISIVDSYVFPDGNSYAEFKKRHSKASVKTYRVRNNIEHRHARERRQHKRHCRRGFPVFSFYSLHRYSSR